MSFLSTPIKQAVEQVSTHLDTPFFIYDLDKLTAHLNQLTAQTDVKLWYAKNRLGLVIGTQGQSRSGMKSGIQAKTKWFHEH